MEILIIGFIVVALMAYASTKIKKAAREAYEAETVATEEYSLKKPEGYLIPALDERSVPKLEIISKAYGTNECAKLRQVELNLIVEKGVELASIRKKLRSEFASIETDELIKDTQKITLTMNGESEKDDCPTRVFVKYFARGGNIYKFKAVVIEENIDEHLENIESMLESIIIF